MDLIHELSDRRSPHIRTHYEVGDHFDCHHFLAAKSRLSDSSSALKSRAVVGATGDFRHHLQIAPYTTTSNETLKYFVLFLLCDAHIICSLLISRDFIINFFYFLFKFNSLSSTNVNLYEFVWVQWKYNSENLGLFCERASVIASWASRRFRCFVLTIVIVENADSHIYVVENWSSLSIAFELNAAYCVPTLIEN